MRIYPKLEVIVLLFFAAQLSMVGLASAKAANCDEVKLNCMSKQELSDRFGKHVGAWANSHCEVYAQTEHCNAFKPPLKNDKYETATFLAKLKVTKVEQVAAYCLMVHELNHLKDFADPYFGQAKTEFLSYQRALACFEEYHSKYCSGKPKNGATWGDCQRIDNAIIEQKAGMMINSCKARGGDKVSCYRRCCSNTYNTGACHIMSELYMK